MNLLITIAAYALIAIAIAPLLFLGLYLLANVLGFNRAAERILDTCSSLLMLQGVVYRYFCVKKTIWPVILPLPAVSSFMVVYVI